MAQQIKEEAASRLISEIRTENVETTTNPERINDTLKKYTKLYTSESKNDPILIDTFFEKLQIPSIRPENKIKLEQPITIPEIKQLYKICKTLNALGIWVGIALNSAKPSQN